MISRERHGPWALIAGGSEGLGAQFAKRAAEQGINLVLLARREAPLLAQAEALRAAHGIEVRTLAIDLTADDMLQQVQALTHGLEIGLYVHNSGGVSGPKLLADMDASQALQPIRLNVIAPTLLSQHFGRLMAAHGRGGIILVGSLGGTAGCAMLSTYASAKSYVQTFAESLWAELQPRGVDVLALVIGRTATPAFLRDMGDNPENPAADPDAMADLAIEHLQDGPIHVPEDLMQAFKGMRGMARDRATRMMSATFTD